MDEDTSTTSADVDASYQKVVDVIRKTVDRPLSDAEAHEAAHNVIGFCRTLLAIHQRTGEQEHEKRT